MHPVLPDHDVGAAARDFKPPKKVRVSPTVLQRNGPDLRPYLVSQDFGWTWLAIDIDSLTSWIEVRLRIAGLGSLS